jgi:hypothetical protein
MGSSFRIYFYKFWQSPTMMTWLSYSTKALSLFGVLPLILKKFSPEDIVLWYLFSTIISLQSVADFGFRQTFSRFISYAYGGVKDINILLQCTNKPIRFEVSDSINVQLLHRIVSSMKHIYKWTTLFVFILLVVFGSLSLMTPIKLLVNASEGWYAWIIVLIISSINFYGKIYMNFLEGFNKIALVRRIESLTSLGAIATSIIVLIYFPSLFNLVLCNQLWVLVVTYRDWYLCRSIDNKIYLTVNTLLPFESLFFGVIWKPAWRSGLSGFMSVGLTNISSMIYAQFGSSVSVASFLLAMRIINQIKEISMAPFYSKISKMTILRVQSENNLLLLVSQRGMLVSNLVFIFSSVLIGSFSDQIIQIINSKVPFVDDKMWCLLTVAFALHRFGAMHVQLYTTTNHIISHIADGITGLIYIISNIILIKYIGIYSLPIAMIISYLGFYCWYAASYSYRSMRINPFAFELKASFFPFLLLIAYCIKVFIAL